MAKDNSTDKSGAAKTAPESTQADEGLPLFFKQPFALDLKRHKKAGLLPLQDVSFATDANSILINGVEFVEAAKSYPIVFTQTDTPLPSVVLGLEQQNYFVDEKGQWKDGAYIPAYVRKYPFVFMNVPEQGQFLLCVDEEAKQFRATGNKETLPFYDGENPSELSRNALEFCTAFHNYHQLTRQFCNALKDADLLVSTRSDAKLVTGREITLGGFLVIDEKKLNSLPDEKILEFQKKGWLAWIHFILQSSTNWKRLVDMAAARDTAKAA